MSHPKFRHFDCSSAEWRNLSRHISISIEMTILRDNGANIGVFVTINQFKQLVDQPAK